MTSSSFFCSHAVTGSYPYFQAIYVCRSCCSSSSCGGVSSRDDDVLLCICQGCAESCHENHEGLEYIGMGPSYCDCPESGCTIYRDSVSKASALVQSNLLASKVSFPMVETTTAATPGTFDYHHNLFSIPSLIESPLYRKGLCDEAMELVKYSKETFWLETSPVDGCGLEQLAWRLYEAHRHNHILNPIARVDDAIGLHTPV